MEWMTSYDKEALENAKYALALYTHQKEVVKKETYLESLLLSDYVDKLKLVQSRYDSVGSIFRDASTELGQDNRHKKFNLKLLKQFLSEDFFGGREVNIKSIIQVGYEPYAWWINIDINGQEYRLTIPMRKAISKHNIEFTDGMFSLSKMIDKNMYSEVAYDYEIKYIATYIEELYKDKEN